MKIYTAGLPVKYVDEAPPVAVVGPASKPVSVEDAIRLAQARAGVPVVTEGPAVPQEEKQILKFTRERGEESPLIDNSKGVANPDNASGQLEHGVVSALPSEPAAGVPTIDPTVPVETFETNTVTFTPDPNFDERAALLARLSELGASPSVPVDVVTIPTPPEGVLQPAVVPADEVGAGKLTAENTVIGVNTDELLK